LFSSVRPVRRVLVCKVVLAKGSQEDSLVLDSTLLHSFKALDDLSEGWIKVEARETANFLHVRLRLCCARVEQVQTEQDFGKDDAAIQTYKAT
jgi:hypothetical protein